MQIRLAGIGGQGVILAGLILGDAAAIEGLNAVQTQDYSAQSRGGASAADVIISKDPIFDVVVTEADVLVALAQEAYENNKHILKEEGILIIDTDLVRAERDFRGAPFTKKAATELNLRTSVNMIMLGYLIGCTRLLKVESVKKAIARRVPKGTEESNLNAFEIGLELAKC